MGRGEIVGWEFCDGLFFGIDIESNSLASRYRFEAGIIHIHCTSWTNEEDLLVDCTANATYLTSSIRVTNSLGRLLSNAAAACSSNRVRGNKHALSRRCSEKYIKHTRAISMINVKNVKNLIRHSNLHPRPPVWTKSITYIIALVSPQILVPSF